MLMSGRCGLAVYWSWRSEDVIRVSAMPGKFSLKNGTRADGSASRVAKWWAGIKSVQVKDLSRDGMAMNMYSPPGQIWRWFGEILKSLASVGEMWNSHQRVSIYSWS